MKISIIRVLSKNKKEHSRTQKSLDANLAAFSGQSEVLTFEDQDVITVYRKAAGQISGDYITMLFDGDTWSENLLQHAADAITSAGGKNDAVFMTRKRDRFDRELPFAQEQKTRDNLFVRAKKKSSFQKTVAISLDERIDMQPLYLGGTFLRRDLFRAEDFHAEDGLECERAFFLNLLLRERKVTLIGDSIYYSGIGREGDVSIFPDVYEKAWYFDSISGFWIPYLQKLQKELGEIPLFVQANCMFSMRSRLQANRNNQNKHLMDAEDVHRFYALSGKMLQLLSDRIVFNSDSLFELWAEHGFYLVYGIIKYGADFRFSVKNENGVSYLAVSNAIVDHLRIKDLATEVRWMNYFDHTLHFDGVEDTLVTYLADEVVMRYDGKRFPVVYTNMYAHNYFFGEAAYKRMSFTVDLPLNGRARGQKLEMFAVIGGKEYPLSYTYHSHFARMSDVCRLSHWCFGEKKQYLMTRSSDSTSMKIGNTNAFGRFCMETGLLFNMFLSFNPKYWQMIPIRLAYHAAKPFLKRKKIWLYFDKIYKGGDSAEYLYRYAQAQKDPNIAHYYLIDRNTTDYQRLVKDGYQPLIRKSIKHRLVFLLADMMVMSNSTSFSFNNFGKINSSFVHDLIESHAVCVQHGMSVQKIAKAQYRLMDNTRLYFCASKYEIENLSKPIYGYTGPFREVLKLTGVPRHDGLIDRHTKQIMISPTWRMQASVKIRTSESEARDYNPLFKDTSYYRVYNSLINDPRLLEAARRYGYRIKYVLHPIVSVQAKDFTPNDTVDIVPSIGDMSYEDMFCESALMVTDFSGIQFDFAYMRKPVLYLHSNEIPAHYDEGTFFYDTMAFGEIAHTNDELIDYLIEYMENDCVMKPEYVRRADDFFAYSDHENCRRIYDVMLEYQEKYI